MWAVYLCGPTDCFLHAMFMTQEQASKWAKENIVGHEGYNLYYFNKPSDIDTTDTGWYL